MNVQRAVLLSALSGAVAVWLASAATSTSRAPIEPLTTRPAAVEASGAELAAEIDRLHERLRPGIAPTETRDLFRYGARPSRRGASELLEIAPPSEAVAAPLPTAAYALIGVAEEVTASGPVRTAIVSGQGQLLFVRAGDSIGAQYRVERVEADALDLQDLQAGTTLRLALK
jgi:hypothetical protein